MGHLVGSSHTLWPEPDHHNHILYKWIRTCMCTLYSRYLSASVSFQVARNFTRMQNGDSGHLLIYDSIKKSETTKNSKSYGRRNTVKQRRVTSTTPYLNPWVQTGDKHLGLSPPKIHLLLRTSSLPRSPQPDFLCPSQNSTTGTLKTHCWVFVLLFLSWFISTAGGPPPQSAWCVFWQQMTFPDNATPEHV